MYNINNEPDMIPQSSNQSSQRDGRNNSRGRQSWGSNSPHLPHFNSPYDSSIVSSRFQSTPYQRFPSQVPQRPWPQHFFGRSPGAMRGSPRFDSPNRTNSSYSESTPRFGSPRRPARFAYKSPQMDASFNSSGEYGDSRLSDSFGSPYSNRTSEEFDVRDYVIPEMTSNPWAELEKQYYAELAQKQI